MRLYQHLRAENDGNGNPRRLFLEIDPDDGTGFSNIIGVHDEGNRGKPPTLRPTAECVELPPINITPAEYAEWRRYGQDKKVWHPA